MTPKKFSVCISTSAFSLSLRPGHTELTDFLSESKKSSKKYGLYSMVICRNSHTGQIQSQINCQKKMGIQAIFFQISDQIICKKNPMFMVFQLLCCAFCYLNMSQMCIHYLPFVNKFRCRSRLEKKIRSRLYLNLISVPHSAYYQIGQFI